jgi:uncharacterized protein YbbC (DUF1343 family)
MMRKMLWAFCLLALPYMVLAQEVAKAAKQKNKPADRCILPGANQMDAYLPLLKGKRVGVFANPTSMVDNRHLVDTLQKLGIQITRIFGPEHGFRGTADAGEKVKNYIDAATGIPVVSLYGAKTKPAATDLADVDILLFDIQDVGVRFYTYISSLQYFIESAIQNNLPLVILDRPNPNGFYVDGPVLDSAYSSFIGMQPVPVVYGMTIGEYAQMLLGESWIPWKYAKKQDGKISLGEALGFEEERNNFKLTVIKCKNYTHKSKYVLPVKPSPNLAEMSAIYWYPSTCYFEGTVLSEGRGTPHPFQQFGHPALPDTLFAFTPVSTAGAAEPKLKDKLCYGWDIHNLQSPNHIALEWLVQAYALFPDKTEFFIKPKKFDVAPQDYFFNKLAGNNQLMQLLVAGKSANEIRQSWQPQLAAFKKIRKKYLLYPDFE